MNNLNMLSVKKVKLHGMTSSKWTTRDKITQYKGLINLYLRDKAIMKTDTNIIRKKQAKELKKLQKDIELSRKILDNAIRGDKQQLRNTLADHREMQLAYQHHEPKKVIDAIHQINFNKRKELDKLEYRLKQKSDKLIDLKLELAVLEDRLKYTNASEFPLEKQAAIVTGKVQDAILKKEAALAINQTFLQIIGIMKKDSLYFDAILSTLKDDAEAQGACMINATKLGQLATEYLDDRRNEYKALEKAVKRDMLARKHDLSSMQRKLNHFSTNIRQLLRRDSDINLGVVTIGKTESELDLGRSFNKIVNTLSTLKSATLVSNFDMIYPCFQTQLNHYEKLNELSKNFEGKRDILRKKFNHADVLRAVLQNSMVETTFQYRTEKRQLLEQIKEQKDRRELAGDVLERKTTLLANVRLGLRQIQQMVKILNFPASNKQEVRIAETEVVKPKEDEVDAFQIILDLKKALSRLMIQTQLVHKLKVPLRHEDMLQNYENMITTRSRSIPLGSKISEEAFLEIMALEISNVPTREEIKRISDEIVETNTKTEEYMAATGKI